jgi:CheY-like chemotaxis protein
MGSHGLRVLVAAPDSAERAVIADVLAATGRVAELIEARDGLEAYALVSARRPDAAIVSASLEGLDGILLVRMLSRSPPFDVIRTLLILDASSAGRVREVMGARPSAIVFRPFDARTLRARFESALAADGPIRARAAEPTD